MKKTTLLFAILLFYGCSEKIETKSRVTKKSLTSDLLFIQGDDFTYKTYKLEINDDFSQWFEKLSPGDTIVLSKLYKGNIDKVYVWFEADGKDGQGMWQVK